MTEHPGTLIYGGTFNPIHIGHMRLALEAYTLLNYCIEKIDFIPNSAPPHKIGKGILPFELRLKMLDAAIAKYPFMSCNPIEGNRPGLSYTYDTLANYSVPKKQRYFLLGSSDYELLSTWHRWEEFPQVSNLAVAPRGDFTTQDFITLTKKMWPAAKEKYINCSCSETASLLTMTLFDNTSIFYLPIPFLEISATRIRELWLNGGNIDFLMPSAAMKILAEQTVTAYWQEK